MLSIVSGEISICALVWKFLVYDYWMSGENAERTKRLLPLKLHKSISLYEQWKMTVMLKGLFVLTNSQMIIICICSSPQLEGALWSLSAHCFVFTAHSFAVSVHSYCSQQCPAPSRQPLYASCPADGQGQQLAAAHGGAFSSWRARYFPQELV